MRNYAQLLYFLHMPCRKSTFSIMYLHFHPKIVHIQSKKCVTVVPTHLKVCESKANP